MSLHIHVFVCAQSMLLSHFTCMPSTSNDILCIHLQQMKRCYWCQFVFEYTCVCVYFLYIASWKPVVGWILLYAQYANPFSDATKTNALSTVTPSTAQMVMMIEKMMMTVMEMIIMMMTGTPTTWRGEWGRDRQDGHHPGQACAQTQEGRNQLHHHLEPPRGEAFFCLFEDVFTQLFLFTEWDGDFIYWF